MSSLVIKKKLAEKLDAIAKSKGCKDWKEYTLKWMRGEVISEASHQAYYKAQTEAEAELRAEGL